MTAKESDGSDTNNDENETFLVLYPEAYYHKLDHQGMEEAQTSTPTLIRKTSTANSITGQNGDIKHDHAGSEDGKHQQNGRPPNLTLHVKFADNVDAEKGGTDSEGEYIAQHHRRPRRTSIGLLDLNDEWLTRDHFLERLEAQREDLNSDVIDAKLAQISESADREKKTCRRKLAKRMTATHFIIFILIVALLDAVVVLTAVILQIHAEHEEIGILRSQSKKFATFTKYAYGKKVDLKDASIKDIVNRVGEYLNKTSNATAGAKTVRKRDLSSLKPDDGEGIVLSRGKRAASTEGGYSKWQSSTAGTLYNIAHNLHYCSIALLSILLLEVCVKIFVLGCEFFKSKVEVIDMFIISVAFFLDVYFIDSVSDNVAAAILLFIWQMIRVCTTLIIQDRKRIEFLLDVVRESNTANKKKVDRLQEKNQSLETAVQRLTTIALYNGATEEQIKRCTDIIQRDDQSDVEDRKSPKSPVMKTIRTAISNMDMGKKKKGFSLTAETKKRKKKLSTDHGVQLVHKQRKGSHAFLHIPHHLHVPHQLGLHHSPTHYDMNSSPGHHHHHRHHHHRHHHHGSPNHSPAVVQKSYMRRNSSQLSFSSFASVGSEGGSSPDEKPQAQSKRERFYDSEKGVVSMSETSDSSESSTHFNFVKSFSPPQSPAKAKKRKRKLGTGFINAGFSEDEDCGKTDPSSSEGKGSDYGTGSCSVGSESDRSPQKAPDVSSSDSKSPESDVEKAQLSSGEANKQYLQLHGILKNSPSKEKFTIEEEEETNTKL